MVARSTLFGLLAACVTHVAICGAAGHASAVRPARPAAGPALRLRGGAGKGAAGGADGCPTEIGGLRPEPGADEEPDGLRLEFHEVKQKQIEALKSGELKVSEELLSRKKDKDAFDKVARVPLAVLCCSAVVCARCCVGAGRRTSCCIADREAWLLQKGNAPVVFMKRYRDANRSLDPYASVGSGP